jgi:hypothetical protein
MSVFNAGDRQTTVDAEQIDDFEGEFATVGGSFLEGFGSPKANKGEPCRLIKSAGLFFAPAPVVMKASVLKNT